MLYVSFLACTKVEISDLTVCIVVNREKFQSPSRLVRIKYEATECLVIFTKHFQINIGKLFALEV